MDSIIMPLKAKVVKKASSSSSMFLELNSPIEGIKYAVVSEETKGSAAFWRQLAGGDPVGQEIIILKMRPLGDAYDVQEIEPPRDTAAYADPDGDYWSNGCEVPNP